MTKPIQHKAVDQLCTQCGLCCNGVLFGDVELQPNDDRAALEAHGLILERKGRKFAFIQPCRCFDGKLCSIYQNRPSRCRGFDCRTLQRVQAGQQSVPAALKSIRQAQAQAGKVRQLLELLGDSDRHLPLSRRYSRMMAQPVDLSGDQSLVDARAQLMLEVDRLMTLLHRDFLA